MASLKRDHHKQSWEDTDFPLVCETCLGDNPYVRMTREPHGKACQICEVPFTVFAWQAGTKGRLKRVEICKNCARTKNVCQVCIFDLQYGLPVQLRDKILAQEGSENAIAAVPQSDANRSYYAQQQARAIEQGTAGAEPNAAAHAKLSRMARMGPRYERNLPKLCSFFARGECDRGSTCPFRHEMPKDRNDPLSKQNTKDRFYGTNDPVADKMEAGQRARAAKRRELLGDVDQSTTTLYVRWDGNNPPVTESEVRDAFYSHGEIVAVRMPMSGAPERGGHAFVEFTARAATELAIRSASRKELFGPLRGRCFVDWARAPKRGDRGEDGARGAAAGDASSGGDGGPVRPLPPPGASDAPAAAAATPVPAVRPAPAMVRPPVTSAAAPGQGGTGVGVPRPGGGVGVPRPGGGVIRRPGRHMSAAPKPYYPSQDPSRMGTTAKAAQHGQR